MINIIYNKIYDVQTLKIPIRILKKIETFIKNERSFLLQNNLNIKYILIAKKLHRIGILTAHSNFIFDYSASTQNYNYNFTDHFDHKFDDEIKRYTNTNKYIVIKYE
jgi:hypothetical protein